MSYTQISSVFQTFFIVTWFCTICFSNVWSILPECALFYFYFTLSRSPQLWWIIDICANLYVFMGLKASEQPCISSSQNIWSSSDSVHLHLTADTLLKNFGLLSKLIRNIFALKAKACLRNSHHSINLSHCKVINSKCHWLSRPRRRSFIFNRFNLDTFNARKTIVHNTIF